MTFNFSRNSITFCILLVSTVFFLSGCKQDIAKSQWTDVSLANGKATVSFPKKPTDRQQSVQSPIGAIQLHMKMCEYGKFAFMANWSNIPVKPEEYDAKLGLKGSIDEVVNRGAKLVSEKPFSRYGFEGRDLLFEDTAKNAFIRGRFFIDGKGPTAYQIMVVGRTKAVVESESAMRFLDSFVVPGAQ